MIPSKCQREAPDYPGIPFLDTYPKDWRTGVHTKKLNSVIHKNQQFGTIQLSTSKQADKLWYICALKLVY